MDQDTNRLDRMESRQEQMLANQATMKQQQTVIVGQLTTLNGSVRDIIVEIGGVPSALGRDPERHSILWRLTRVEEAKDAAVAANAALGLIFGRAARFVLVLGSLVAIAVGISTLAKLFAG